ncbi:MAG: sialate O-acetylesterase [Kiritimatiellia bacterium]
MSTVCAGSLVQAERLQVYILVGQSNMQGHAKTSTFDYIRRDPQTAPMLKDMLDASGKPVVCKNVWISHVEDMGDLQAGAGRLTAGYGADYRPGKLGERIGPEYTFGITMQKLVDAPILIIKSAWGGKSLHTDFRPPSAATAESPTGEFYQRMLEHVQKVLADPGQIVPSYDPAVGYEIAGFVWFQGWNDMVAGNVYPQRNQPGGYDLYTELLAQFIRDVRRDFGAPDMRFVIGVMGVGGPTELYESPRYKGVHQNFRDAMAAPASMPEFKGNTVAVLTEAFWDHELDAVMQKKERTEEEQEIARGASNRGFHYLGAAKILGQIGVAFAEAMVAE